MAAVPITIDLCCQPRLFPAPWRDILAAMIVWAASAQWSGEHSWDWLSHDGSRAAGRQLEELSCRIANMKIFPDQAGHLQSATRVVDSRCLPDAPLGDALFVLDPGVVTEVRQTVEAVNRRLEPFMLTPIPSRVASERILTFLGLG